MSQSKGVETFYPGLDILGSKLFSLMLDCSHWASNLSQALVNGDTSGGRYLFKSTKLIFRTPNLSYF